MICDYILQLHKNEMQAQPQRQLNQDTASEAPIPQAIPILSSPVIKPPSLIHVAELALGGGQELPQRHGLPVNHVPEVLLRQEGAVPVRLVFVVGRQRAADGGGDVCGAGVRVLHLPHPPDAVDVGVVRPEGRVAGAGVDVAARVAAERVVPAAVDA